MAVFERWLEHSVIHSGSSRLPHVTLTYAQSLDGSIAFRRSERTALSGPESTRLTHQLRGANDAFLIGIGTLLADDPLLTARLPEAKDPQPVVLDTHLRTPLQARVITQNQKSALIACAEPIDPNRRKLLEASSARLIVLPNRSDGLELTALLDCLADLGVKRLMVEGGAGVISSFLREGLVDQLIITIAPVFMGGLRPFDELQNQKFGLDAVAPRLRQVEYERFGEDLIVWGTLRG